MAKGPNRTENVRDSSDMNPNANFDLNCITSNSFAPIYIVCVMLADYATLDPLQNKTHLVGGNAEFA
jgi:hypothetical protein